MHAGVEYVEENVRIAIDVSSEKLVVGRMAVGHGEDQCVVVAALGDCHR